MKNHPFTLAMPPNNITILAICTILCICAGGRGVSKLVHHHIPNTKLTQRDDNIIASRIAISYLHRHTRECASVLRRMQGVKRYRDDSHCACAKSLPHAQNHFSPETKSKVRPKKNSPGSEEVR